MRDDRRPDRRFDATARAYARGRPRYPSEVSAWLVEAATLAPGARCLDLAAGTGDLTVALVDAGLEVLVCEPAEQMRAVLSDRLPGVEQVAGGAESLALPDDSVDLVTIANAMHWLRPEGVWPQLERVVRPGGHVAVIWNMPDVRQRVAQQLRDLRDLPTDPAERPGPLPGTDPGWTARFSGEQTASFGHVHRLDRAGLRDLVASWSLVAHLPEDERAAVLTQAEGFMDGPEIAIDFVVEICLARLDS